MSFLNQLRTSFTSAVALPLPREIRGLTAPLCLFPSSDSSVLLSWRWDLYTESFTHFRYTIIFSKFINLYIHHHTLIFPAWSDFYLLGKCTVFEWIIISLIALHPPEFLAEKHTCLCLCQHTDNSFLDVSEVRESSSWKSINISLGSLACLPFWMPSLLSYHLWMYGHGLKGRCLFSL